MTNNINTYSAEFKANMTGTLAFIEGLDEEQAKAFEVGAVSVLGIIGGAIGELQERTIRGGIASGASADEATQVFDHVFGAMTDLVDPHVTLLQEATQARLPKVDPVEQVTDLLAGLLESLCGAEAAAEFRAEVAAESEQQDEDEPLAEWERELLYGDDEYDDEDEVQFVDLTDIDDEATAQIRLLQAIFAR